MFPNMSNRCWKCKHDVGTFSHMWWTCEYVKKYWIKIHKRLEEMLQKPLAFKPEIFLLGIVPENISKQEMYLILHLITVAKIALAQYRKKPNPMSKTGLDESPVGIKIAGRNINNLRYVDDTILMAESEEELKSLLMQEKEESAKVGLKLNIKKTKIM
ncbi:LINE-1 retrotransposable element ORF2 protein [Varanus komodoensis]|nr:LINE-1 retrotransposable element ORF2 protein [Varanus komodoensis]